LRQRRAGKHDHDRCGERKTGFHLSLPVGEAAIVLPPRPQGKDINRRQKDINGGAGIAVRSLIFATAGGAARRPATNRVLPILARADEVIE
jgi:hypothetical protein